MLDGLAKRKRRDLMATGFTEPDLFELRRVGNVYRNDALTPEIMATVLNICNKLESVTLRL